MAIFFGKRVLTEKVSKMLKLVPESFIERAIFITNEQIVFLYEENEAKSVLAWTYLPVHLVKDNTVLKMTELYTFAGNNSIQYDGIAATKFVTSGFREILTNDIEDDRIWLVTEKLCQIGLLFKNIIIEFLREEETEIEDVFNKQIVKECSLIGLELDENSVKLTHRMWMEKYGSVRVIRV